MGKFNPKRAPENNGDCGVEQTGHENIESKLLGATTAVQGEGGFVASEHRGGLSQGRQ